MRLTIRTSLALKALMFCAVNPDRVLRRHEMARACGGSENHLAQVIHQLARHGFIRTRRGRSGGMSLACAPHELSVGAVFRAVEVSQPLADCIGASGPVREWSPVADGFEVATPGCSQGQREAWRCSPDSGCPLACACRLGAHLNAALEAFVAHLDTVTIADLVEDNAPLEALLRVA